MTEGGGRKLLLELLGYASAGSRSGLLRLESRDFCFIASSARAASSDGATACGACVRSLFCNVTRGFPVLSASAIAETRGEAESVASVGVRHMGLHPLRHVIRTSALVVSPPYLQCRRGCSSADHARNSFDQVCPLEKGEPQPRRPDQDLVPGVTGLLLYQLQGLFWWPSLRANVLAITSV